MTNLILHIPHSSDRIPMTKGYVVDKQMLEQEIIKLTDWYTDDLFFFEESVMIRADFSRIFCDTERFSEDSQEVMAQYGMGVLYEKSDDGAIIRRVSPELRKEILDNYYWPHHKRLSEAVQNQLDQHGKALIVDCHSFPNNPFVRDLNQEPNRPDFNIGIDPYHTPEYLVRISKEYFSGKGYSLGLNWPYSGSIVPIAYYQKSKSVESIMLEINRALYLKGSGKERSEDYTEVKQVVTGYLEALRTCAQSE